MLQVAGGPELLVVFLVMFLLFGPVVLAVVALVKYTDGGTDRLDELEARVAELEGRNDGEGEDGDGPHDAHDTDGGVDRSADGIGGDPDRETDGSGRTEDR